jgi:far upstream element-binding protein
LLLSPLLVLYIFYCAHKLLLIQVFIGTKRGYYDDDREDSHPSYGATRSYGSYQDDRDSKRSAYDGGSSRPSCKLYITLYYHITTVLNNTLIDGSGNESRRYGLGSEERKPSYGGSTQHQEQYSVPNHMVGLLIGKGGENLKKIERVSGVHKVQFANGMLFLILFEVYMYISIHTIIIDPVDGERPVYLSGEPDQVAIARDMIRQMVADASSNDQNRFSGGGSRHSDQAGGGSTLTIRIPMNKVGLVIGRGGETIRDFEERSKAKILIASDTGSERDNERVINLVGDDAAVQYAKSLIEDIVNGNNNVSHVERDPKRQTDFLLIDWRSKLGPTKLWWWI